MTSESTADDAYWMRHALLLAEQAATAGEVPVGAVVVQDNRLLGAAYNRPITDCDPTAHAEILALRQAAQQLGNYRLLGCTLYATLEPCPMCAGALIHARIARVVFAAADPRAGACGTVFQLARTTTLNHRAEILGGVLADASSDLLRMFFRARRNATPPGE